MVDPLNRSIFRDRANDLKQIAKKGRRSVSEVISFIGIPDNNRATVMVNKGTPSSFQLNIAGTNDLSELFDKKTAPFRQIILGGNQPERPNIDQANLILNTISDPDASIGALHQASELTKTLNTAIINHPDYIVKTTRDGIYRLFKDIEGFRVPKTIKVAPRCLNDVEKLIQEGSVVLPVIFREAGTHNGLKSCLLESPDQLYELEQFAFDGRGYYITQFVDFRSKDGLYRKARILIIDGIVFPSHLIVSTKWNIHAGSRKELMENNKEYQMAEEKFLTYVDTEILRRFRTIYEILKLDFFGIDCNINEQNEILIFEINASMKPFGSNPNPAAYKKRTNASIREVITGLVTSRLPIG